MLTWQLHANLNDQRTFLQNITKLT